MKQDKKTNQFAHNKCYTYLKQFMHKPTEHIKYDDINLHIQTKVNLNDQHIQRIYVTLPLTGFTCYTNPHKFTHNTLGYTYLEEY